MDLKRDISYDKNGELKPTKVIYSAYPYVIEPIAPFLGNLTCNPGLLSDLFLNNPEANVGNKFKDRDEVVTALGDVLGPGCDISIELNNPFDPEFAKVLDEAERFREILSPGGLSSRFPTPVPSTTRTTASFSPAMVTWIRHSTREQPPTCCAATTWP